MDAIDYVEATVAAALTEAKGAYDTMHERAYKFVTLVMGAAGAMAVYGLGKIGTADYLLQLVPLGVWAFYLFWVASRLLLKGAATQQMTSGTTCASLHERLMRHAKNAERADPTDADVNFTRWDQARTVDEQILAFSKGASDRAKALDLAYKRVAFSPIIGAAGLLLALSS